MRNVYLVTGKYTGFFWCISEFVCMKLYFNYWVYAKNSKYVINTMITMQNCWTAHCCYCPIFKAQSFPAQPSRTTSWSVNQKSVNISCFLKLKSKYPIKWIFCWQMTKVGEKKKESSHKEETKIIQGVGSLFFCQFYVRHQDACCCYSVANFVLLFCDPMDCSPPGSCLHGISQARLLVWVAVYFSRVSSWPRDQTHVSCVSCIGRQVIYNWDTWEAQNPG